MTFYFLLFTDFELILLHFISLVFIVFLPRLSLALALKHVA